MFLFLRLLFPQIKRRTTSYLPGQPNITMTLAMLGKGIITAGTSMIYVFLAELYPTVLRNTASGACSILARVGGGAASFIFQLGESSKLSDPV